MILHRTGHAIADTVSDLIGELPDGNYKIAYGILRHSIFNNEKAPWFEIDKGFWHAAHYGGNYRLSYRGTQPVYAQNGPQEDHGLTLQPWKQTSGYTLICPPSTHVCEFFNVHYTTWLMNAVRLSEGTYLIRNKGTTDPIDWDSMGKLITFNSTLAIDALVKGIPVISNQLHSTVGNYTRHVNSIMNYDREPLLRFCQGHQFRLSDKAKIVKLIEYYLNGYLQSN